MPGPTGGANYSAAPRPTGVIADRLAGPGSDGRQETPRHVFVIGRIEGRSTGLGLEPELAQAVARADTAGLTDAQALHTVLGDRANRFLARRMCWVLTIQGLDTYVLHPQDPVDFEVLVEATRPRPRATDMDVVIGMRVGISPPEMCGGLALPLIAFDQIYSFDRETLTDAIPRDEGVDDETFSATAEEVLDMIMQLTDNTGATDEHRALNYLAVRYPDIYTRTAQAHLDNKTLARVESKVSRLSGARRLVDVILTYRDRRSDVLEKYFARVDVTEEFVFLVSKLSPYFDRA